MTGAMAAYCFFLCQAVRINETSELDDCCAELSKLLRAVVTTMNQFMSVPIYNTLNAVVGVLQLVNKVKSAARSIWPHVIIYGTCR